MPRAALIGPTTGGWYGARGVAVGLALSVAVGCDGGSPHAPEPTASKVSTPVVPLPSGSAAPDTPPSGCTLHGSWTADVDLLLTGTNTAYATLGRGNYAVLGAFGGKAPEAELSIPDGPAVRFGAYWSSNELTLEGSVDAAAATVLATKPFVIAGFLILAPDTRLRVRAATSAGLDVEPLVEPHIILTGRLITDRRACSDLTLTEAAFDPKTASPAPVLRSGWLRPGEPVPLAVEANGPTVAHLLPEGAEAVDILEVRGTRTRIAWRSGAVVFGWIASSALGARPAESGRRSGEEGKMGGRAKRWPLVCGADVPLSVEDSGVRPRVGQVRRGAHIRVLEREGGWARVEVQSTLVRAAGDARWVAREADLANCVTPPGDPGDALMGEIKPGVTFEGVGSAHSAPSKAQPRR